MKTHDYTQPRLGHDFIVLRVIDDGKCLKIAGWGLGIEPGDYLVLPGALHCTTTTRYQVEVIKYKRNPADMWFADCKFAPREAI